MHIHFLLLLIILLLKFCDGDYLYPAIQTTSSLPEIIINKNAAPGSSGYYYPVPQPPNDVLPPLQDEIPTIPIDNGYLPPPSNEYLPPQQDFQPFQPAPHPVYGVPSTLQKQNGNFDTSNGEPTVRVISMTCLDSSDTRFFKATIQSTDFISTSPVFTKNIFGCNILKKANEIFVINLEAVNVGNCGVRYCANKKMCLNLRLPTVQGLQLPEDRFITLQCLPQHSIASVVRSMGIRTQKIQPRAISINTIAAGGSQRPFRPYISLYRKGNQLVEPGSTVFLGEDLLLKATINDSDDWKFTKIGSVVMQQGIQTSNGRKSVTLVDNDGCRIESMKSVCPNHPEQITNKITVVPFRAFLFQDVDADEMLLSVRLYGCMHQKDCQQTKHCEEKVVASNALNTLDGGKNLSMGRRKRMVNGLNSTHVQSNYYSSNDTSQMTMVKNNDQYTIDSVQNYESHLDFRVVLPRALKLKDNTKYLGWSMDDIYNGYLFVSVVLIIGVTCIVILCVVIKVRIRSKMLVYSRDY